MCAQRQAKAVNIAMSELLKTMQHVRVTKFVKVIIVFKVNAQQIEHSPWEAHALMLHSVKAIRAVMENVNKAK